MAKLIMVRHGESCWNNKNRFTGWVDVPLSPKGVKEAIECGKQIKHLPIDVIFTSTLIRAQMTTFLIMSEHSETKVPVVQHAEGPLHNWGKIYDEKTKEDIIPVYYASELNERMYGELQGLNKKETAEKFGEKQVKIWRRSYNISPPEGESLADTAKRTLPYFKKEIMPYLEQGKNVLISAHGNSLRAIRMYIDNLSEDEILHLEIATGEPIVYNYTDKKLIKTSL